MTHRDDFPGIVGVESDKIGYTCKLKVYPDGSVAVTAADRPIFHPEGWEVRAQPSAAKAAELLGTPGVIGPDRVVFEAAQRKAAESLARSKRRALTAVRDYAMCNDFRYFVTLTLDSARVDRYDYGEIVGAMRTWCDNQVRRKGLRYILVPELHKDGAIHFHGFFPDGVEVTDSGTIIPPGGSKPKKPRSKAQRAEWLSGGGHLVYNLPDWRFGWSTAIELYGRRAAAVAYVCKYISKAPDKIGGRWYFSGGKLRKPDVQYTDATIADVMRESTINGTGEVSARVYDVPAAGLRLCYDFKEVGRYDSNG